VSARIYKALNSSFSARPKALAVAVSLALAAGFCAPAGAAGLGRLTVQSALGQPLQAEVEITALSREEATSVTARVAPPDAFRQAGLEYNPVVSSFRLAIGRRADGRPVLTITSTRPVNEAFVDLLVELNWASGRLLREYTFLLDPPELRMGKTDAVDTAGVRTPAVRAGAPAAPGTAPSTASAAPPPVPLPPVAPVAPATARARPPAAIEIQRGDTLASIAATVKPPAANLDQTIISLYRANPDAFFGSPHQMYSGRTLKVPDAATTVAIDPVAARREIRSTVREFEAYRARLAEAAGEIPAAKTGQAAAGAISPKAEERPPAAPGDQLRLSKGDTAVAAPGAKAGPAGAPAGQVGTQTGQQAAEARVATDAALREAQSRMTDLERNVNDLQKLLELKNRQLADLERQLAEAKLAGKTAVGAITPGAAVVPAVPAAPPTMAQAPVAAPPVPAAGAAPAEVAPAPTPAPEVQAAKPVEPVVAPKPPTPAPATAMPGFFDELLDNPLLLPGLGGLALAGGFYAWYLRRRRKGVERFEDSLVSSDAFSANSLFGATGGQSVDTDESLFASSMRNTTGLDVHSTEVDPIAEAEVYIAYGREAQAEEILREALAKQPTRQAIRLKLLEILAGRKDVAGFSALAEEMVATTGGQNEEWPKVVMLGLSIDPTNPMYTGQEPAEQTLGMDTAIFTPQEPPTTIAKAPPAAPADVSALAPDEGAADLDFDLDLEPDTTVGRAGDRLQESAATAAPSRAESSLENALEGRVDLPSLDLGKSAEPDAIADLDDFDVEIPSFETLRGPAEVESPRVDLSSIGLDLSLDTVTKPVDGDAERWQEIATKLDLAGAYEEIGDKEGARELLEEVVAGGDSAQQEKAREILARLG